MGMSVDRGVKQSRGHDFSRGKSNGAVFTCCPSWQTIPTVGHPSLSIYFKRASFVVITLQQPTLTGLLGFLFFLYHLCTNTSKITNYRENLQLPGKQIEMETAYTGRKYPNIKLSNSIKKAQTTQGVICKHRPVMAVYSKENSDKIQKIKLNIE